MTPQSGSEMHVRSIYHMNLHMIFIPTLQARYFICIIIIIMTKKTHRESRYRKRQLNFPDFHRYVRLRYVNLRERNVSISIFICTVYAIFLDILPLFSAYSITRTMYFLPFFSQNDQYRNNIFMYKTKEGLNLPKSV